MPDLIVLVLAGLAVFAGAVLQGGTGIGLALVATPIVQLLHPALMPGAMLVVACGLALLTVAAEARHADWPGLGWALGGRLVGTAASAGVIAMTSVRGLNLFNGSVVLLVAAVVAIAPSWLPRNRLTLAGSGMFAGVAATTAAIGGPLIALVYRRSPGPTMRGSLGAFTTVGSLLSLLCVALVGLLSWVQILGGLALLPFAGAGFVVAERVRRHLKGRWIRGAVLVLAVLAALSLILRSLPG
ncbi:TSUP family transporter [Nonomuraea phyllanthi]|uniref:TSUP family transporter n=1 Tax=Nonomuraea phyllanthi TaxID=2219224 RepID=UPI001292F561|nr:TSUP family transporter [Nonomuraea phyllanthi]QFY07542.1 TSUP family transporter [Nonomuraea phyllanthi]